MYSIPSAGVWATGNIYQEAATLLNEHRHYWAAAINAALAIEIYIKAFLSEEEKSFLFEMEGIYLSGNKVKRGHDLVDLYEKISIDYRSKLEVTFKEKCGKVELLQELKRYRNVFTDARYNFELSSRPNLDNGIVFLAEKLREVLHCLGTEKELTPKIG